MEKTISEIRKEFFAFRNGVLATRLRESGDPHAVIMGCLLADVVSIVRRYEPSVELAEALWADVKHRECRLAAPMLFPPSEMEREQAMEWARGVQSEEEADVLCHRLLRRVTGAEEMACELMASDVRLEQYAGLRLLMNLLVAGRLENHDAVRAALEQSALKVWPENARLLKEVEEDSELAFGN